MRINKYLAHKGIATRKAADMLVEKGLVKINGRRAVLGDKVSESDNVEVNHSGKKYRYFAYNKPVGVITHSPQLGEREIATSTKLTDIFPVGRLDKASHGLIILTDDARITDRLLSPQYDHDKEYFVQVRQELPNNFKKRMESGVRIDGHITKKCRVDVVGPKSFRITLTEGKKHQIRRMCAALRLDIVDLERTRIMNIKLGRRPAGARHQIVGDELKLFLKGLGL
ncbi:MAG TPA: pseudouridine synthase [Candidatus Paceibacterota bacterium]